MLNRLSFELKF